VTDHDLLLLAAQTPDAGAYWLCSGIDSVRRGGNGIAAYARLPRGDWPRTRLSLALAQLTSRAGL
jgi:hypothetical protein